MKKFSVNSQIKDRKGKFRARTITVLALTPQSAKKKVESRYATARVLNVRLKENMYPKKRKS